MHRLKKLRVKSGGARNEYHNTMLKALEESYINRESVIGIFNEECNWMEIGASIFMSRCKDGDCN